MYTIKINKVDVEIAVISSIGIGLMLAGCWFMSTVNTCLQGCF